MSIYIPKKERDKINVEFIPYKNKLDYENIEDVYINNLSRILSNKKQK